MKTKWLSIQIATYYITQAALLGEAKQRVVKDDH